MALYDIKLNGALLAPENPSWWGISGAEGLHTVPVGRDLEMDNPWGPGMNVIPGPPASFFFALDFWVEGDGHGSNLEVRLADLMRRFRQPGYSLNHVFEWERYGFSVMAPCRITSATPEIDYQGRSAKMRVTFENLAGAWRSAVESTKNGVASGQLVVNEGDSTIFDATITVKGPITNPRFTTLNRWVQFNGSLTASDTLVIKTSPISAIKNDSTDVISSLDWAGSAGRGLDIAPGDTFRCSASSSGTGHGWTLKYRNNWF